MERLLAVCQTDAALKWQLLETDQLLSFRLTQQLIAWSCQNNSLMRSHIVHITRQAEDTGNHAPI